MAAFNVSLDDSSPLITYLPSNAWTDTPSNDTAVKTYFDASLHTTSTKGASASFKFNGTGVWLYGGHRSTYGNYLIAVDGKNVTAGSAKSSKTQVKQALGGSSGLKMGEHTVTLTNEGGGSIDVDELIFETTTGTSGTMKQAKIDDANSSVKYGPKTNSWSLTNGTSYYDKTLHFSTTSGAYATLSFTGNAVAVYGTVDPTHAPFTITLDGVKSQHKANGVSSFHTQTLLYFAQGLNSSQHTITLTGNPTNSSQYFDLDYFTVYGANASSTTTSSGSAASSTSSVNNASNNNGTISGNTSNNSTLSQGSIIGIVVGSISAILLLLVVAFLYLRRRRTHARFNPFGPRSAQPRNSPSPGIPIQNPPDIEAQYDTTLDEKQPLTAERRLSDEYGSRRLSDDYYPRTVTARLQAFPSDEPNDKDIVPHTRLSPSAVSAPSLLSPGIAASGLLSPGIPPSGRLSPGIPQSGRLSPGGLPASPRMFLNRGLSPTPRLSPIPQLSPMPRYSPVPRDDDRDMPQRGASRSDQVPTLVIHNPPDSSHARMPSDTSTVVSDEVDAGLSEIILSPAKSQWRPPNSPRSPRPREELRKTQFSGLDYYYDS